MKRIFLAALALLAIPTCTAASASAQSVTGCGATTIAKADQSNTTRLTTQADCFGKVKTIATTAEIVRRARIEAIKPAPVPSPTPAPAPVVVTQAWKDCAGEGERCGLIGEARVRYGAGDRLATKIFVGGTQCGNQVFGDAAPGAAKRCSWQPTDGTEPVALDPNGPAKLIPAGVRPWPMPAKPTTRRGLLGVNVAGLAWWSGEQTYTNLAMAAEWRDTAHGWAYLTRDQLGADGIPLAKLVGSAVDPITILTPAAGSQAHAVPAYCTWAGTGVVRIEGEAHVDARASDHRWDFTWYANRDYSKFTWLRLQSTSVSDPIRSIDCRAAADAGATSIFSPKVLAYYRAFGTLRFLDASGVNGNGPWRWATRTLPGSLAINGSDGMALEDQVRLAREADADGWYNVSWNADEDYQRRMAQLIHDGTPATRHVYVELSNEVWNFAFGVANQARTEGAALNLSGDGDAYKSGLYLYAQKTAALMRIWTQVFTDRPGQLIRVVGTQQDNPWVSSVILAEAGLGRSGLVDALASAPYFGASVPREHPAANDNDMLFPLLRADMGRILGTIQPQNLALAKQYGMRSISYEAGQHVVAEGRLAMVQAVNRDPRMGALYDEYIPAAVAANDNDLVVLFAATGPISQYGAWGMREYAGQPLAEAPKMRAALDYAAGR